MGIFEVFEDKGGERFLFILIFVGIVVLLCLIFILLVFIIRKKRKDFLFLFILDSTMTVVFSGFRKVVVKIDINGDFIEV